jgi:hypothetical protein
VGWGGLPRRISSSSSPCDASRAQPSLQHTTSIYNDLYRNAVITAKPPALLRVASPPSSQKNVTVTTLAQPPELDHQCECCVLDSLTLELSQSLDCMQRNLPASLSRRLEVALVQPQHLGHPLPCGTCVYVCIRLVKPEPGHVCQASRTRPHPQHPPTPAAPATYLVSVSRLLSSVRPQLPSLFSGSHTSHFQGQYPR